MKNEKLSIHTAAGYRIFAQETNTESFIHTFGRNPRDYEEVKNWVNSCVEAASAGCDPEPKPEERFEIINGKVWSVRSFV